MDRQQDFVEIGRVIKAHGLYGMLKISFDERVEQLADNIVLCYLRNERGDFYPARISECRPDITTPHLFFVQFEHISDRTAAEKLKDHAIFLEQQIVPGMETEPVSEFSHLIDLEVVNDKDENIGIVSDVMPNPAHPILLIASSEGSKMIPFVDHFVKEVTDDAIRCINLDELEGI